MRDRGTEEGSRHLAGEQAVTVLGVDRRMPNRIVHAQADKPAEQQVEVDLLGELTLRADREGLQQQRLEHLFGRNGRSPGAGMKPGERRVHADQHLIDHHPDHPWRMLR